MNTDFTELRHSCDFSGWATKNDYPCSDGRTIKKNAFIKDHGKKVPLVWNHRHDAIDNVLGHAYLENRDDGVYAYCFLNDTEQGKNAKEYVQHGDLTALSIWANGLKQRRGDVLHGCIRELSLVLAGANPGAYIDNPIVHGDFTDDETEACIKFIIPGDEPSSNLSHSDEEPEIDDLEESEDDEELEHSDQNKTVKDVFDSFTDEQKNVVYYLIAEAVDEAMNKGSVEHSDDNGETFEGDDSEDIEHSDDDKTIKDVFNSFTDEQKNVVYYLIAEAIKENQNNQGDEQEMAHNVFEANTDNVEDILQHSAEEIEDVFSSAKSNRVGSLRDHFLSHGITEIESLFPDYKTLDNPPTFIKRPDGWVSKVMNGVKHTPFSRIRSRFADITGDEARARGFVKGKAKVEEVFVLLSRTTDPQTIYKKQKLHRDDIIDITDFDVVAWLKLEMRQMLEEEIARAILIGDGRSALSDDKIKEDKIRPIWTDNETLFTISAEIEIGSADTPNTRADKFIDKAVRAKADYRGAGNPTLFVEPNIYADMLLQKDLNGRRIYTSTTELATALLVKEIVPVEVMKNKTRTVTRGEGQSAVTTTNTLLGIIVNLADYTVGADKGGAVALFDDFDIDYNAYKYLIETRMSGALTTPFSAIIMESIPASE